MVCVDVSPYCELARWTLDHLGVTYTQENHVPVLHAVAARRYGGGIVVPVLNLGKGHASLTDARQVVDYYGLRAPESERLFPADPDEHAQARQLFDELFDRLGVAVRAWAYAYMLPVRASTVRAWIDGAPRLQRAVTPIAYPLLRFAVGRNLGLGPDSIPRERAIIDELLTTLQARLSDRRYLLGDRLTAPDLALAALLAPAVLPPEYRGPLPAIDELPAAMRREVEQYRAHPVGRFALRLFAEQRG